jgi:hypothetical protein
MSSNHTRFKRGQSGNPAGRPKGAKGIKTLIAAELKGPITVQEGGRRRRIRRAEALAKGLVNDALQGRDRPRERVLRYADAIEEEQQRRTAVDLSERDRAILDRYVERRIRAMEIAKRSVTDDEQ